MRYRIAPNENLRQHLAAAYVIRSSTPLSIFDDEASTIPPCSEESQARCVVAYTDIEPNLDIEKRRYRQRALVWREDTGLASKTREPLLCVNPLSWSIDDQRAGAAGHIGAASATGLGMRETPPHISRAIGAQCNAGILIVDRPRQNFLRRRHWFGAHWQPQNFNLFYHDLTADARRRVANLHSEKNDEVVANGDAGADKRRE